MGRPNHILITGASGGIGGALARQLARQGRNVFLGGRDVARLESLAAELNAPYLAGDLTGSAGARELVAAAREQLGLLDGVAHCVGSLLLKPGHRTTDSEWLDTLHTHLSSAFFIMRESVQLMPETGGSLVFISSAAARHGFANHEAIAGAKAGIIGLTLSAAATQARRNIRVNCVAPGLTQTPLTGGLTSNEASLKASAAMHALGRIGQPEEIAAAIQFLLDHEWITGEVLSVSGGLGSVHARSG
ncbi:MAG TPA: hypothetical protein DCY13_07000 [Verrucomicrobiales bacterium]|nr:hypothetical protein [Verrucomicrobiales bacterium]